MTNLAITADDYGLHPEVNRGIEQLANHGYITSSSILCHQDAHLEQLSNLNPNVALGVHLCFVEERPLLTNDPQLQPLLDSEGRLPSNYKKLFLKIVRHPSVLPALCREAQAQIQRFLDLGLTLHFINSHQHTHLFPPIWLCLAPVWQQYDVPIRGVHTFKRPNLSPQGMVNLAGWISWQLKPLKQRPVLTPLGVSCAGKLNFTHSETLFAAESFTQNIQDNLLAPDNLLELVTHPGFNSPKLQSLFPHWNYHWQEELELLQSDVFKQLLHQFDLVLKSPDRTMPLELSTNV